MLKNLGKLFLVALGGITILIVWIIINALSYLPFDHLFPTNPTFSVILESIPSYPSSKFLHNYRTGLPDDYPSEGRIFESDDNPKAILAFYKNKLISLGWIITGFDDQPQKGVPSRLSATKDIFKGVILVDETNPRRININISRR